MNRSAATAGPLATRQRLATSIGFAIDEASLRSARSSLRRDGDSLPGRFDSWVALASRWRRGLLVGVSRYVGVRVLACPFHIRLFVCLRTSAKPKRCAPPSANTADSGAISAMQAGSSRTRIPVDSDAARRVRRRLRMFVAVSYSIPTEQLTTSTTYELSGHLPTRLSGNSRAPSALDPYDELLADGGQMPYAISFDVAQRMVDAGRHKMPAAYRRAKSTFDPREQAPSRLNAAINLLGVLLSWGAVTNNQAASFVGVPALADPRCDLVADLFASGLLNLHSPFLGLSAGVAGDGTAVYQLGDGRTLARFIERLSVAEATALTGGRPVRPPAVNVRHDVLAAELALRAATHLQIGAVLGPRFSTYADLAAPGSRLSEKAGGPDLVLVRDDGLRIAVELTTSIGKGFGDKVQNWTDLLIQKPFVASGMTVVFLVAPSRVSRLRRGDRVRRAVYSHVASPKHATYLRKQVGVATWQEWFPRPWTASHRFAALEVDQLNSAGDGWERRATWDPSDLTLETNDRRYLRSVISAASLLSQTPFSLRHEQEPASISSALLRSEVGMPKPADPLRKDAGRRVPGARHGVASAARIPARLIGPTDESKQAAGQRVIGPTRFESSPGQDPVFGHQFPDPEEECA